MTRLRTVTLLLTLVGLAACAPREPFLPVASVVSNADCNEDGRLTWPELSRTTYSVEGESKDRAFTFANFTQADTNSDEVLTLAEIRTYFQDKHTNGFNFDRNCD